ncbi:ABC transporter ATP-binding protein [Rubrobacter xylanophilus]|uniref:ABC transporter ATP-binding protein n=1 Tax=Rubrobacter xylanophilus TaxID=49319 RepID=A0A510HLV8_9ACTN|nr:ABC transporter ATP-binding protein [Rubrobacter xylanophilus]BBL80989.1 ABC transporter ATP-binding protein [Rubrobacter xylanophilus]
MDAIEVEGLEKHYGKKIQALRGVELRVRRGEVFGLVGPNGAGKTTLIKALVGSLRPTGGRARVLGLDPLKERGKLRQRIGYMPQSPVLYDDLSAQDNVAFFGRAHRTADLRRRVREVLEFTGLEERAKDPVHTLSGGMKNRVSLACALVHEPEMLFLDEPTAGVDPQLRSRFWEQFRKLAGGGATLFVSTHLMEEATLCDRIAILHQGRVIAADSPRRLLQRGKTRLIVERDGRREERLIGGRPEDLAEALKAYGLAREISALSVEADSLETVVLSLIGEEQR